MSAAVPIVFEHLPCFLANQPLHTGQWLFVDDKYHNTPALQVALADATHVEKAIAAAVAAQEAMAQFTPDARRDVLRHCVMRFEQLHEPLAQLLCTEAGKPIRDARVEVDRLIATFQIAAEEATRPPGDMLNLSISPNTRHYRGLLKHVPVGVCSFITPFNFPLNLIAHKIAPAIAAGCPFILKPALNTPASALVVGQVLAETALPEGAFSILPCHNDDAAALIEDARIALLSFTGSERGWDLKARAGHKKVTLELGGNAACIVDADPGAGLDAVVERLCFGAYYQSGQSCISVQRILAHRVIYADLKAKLLEKISQLQCGDPHHEATFIGPVIDANAAHRISQWVEQAQQQGARLLIGGQRKGNLLTPCLLENVPANTALAQREVFGPVAYLEAFDNFSAALQRVNESAYGLQAGVFTASMAHALQAWDTLQVGGVIVGDVPSVRIDSMPYGGIKQSGQGREGIRWAIAEMSEPRLMVIRQW